ncbi:MAG: HlyD family secretion protein [Leptospirales bacterium]
MGDFLRWNGVRSPKFWIPLLGLLLTIIIFLAYERYNEFYVTTDDSAVDGNIILISANTAGRVMSLPLNQGDPVQKGMELARIDTTGFQTLRMINEDNQKAYEDLQNALSTEASLEVLLSNARSQYIRGIHLKSGGFITKQDLDNLKTAVEEDKVRLKQAKRLVLADRMRLEMTESHPLNYTVHSPISGQVSERISQIGEVVSPGQPLLSIVDPSDIWITAKVKETRMKDVRVGQPVDINVDTYDGHTFHGHVDRLLPVSAAAVSLLPPENASGTFVKVIQRIPVRIRIDNPGTYSLRPGMSTEVKIHVRKGSPW